MLAELTDKSVLFNLSKLTVTLLKVGRLISLYHFSALDALVIACATLWCAITVVLSPRLHQEMIKFSLTLNSAVGYLFKYNPTDG